MADVLLVPATNSMPHGNRPEKTPPTALESAAHDIRRVLRPDGTQLEGSLAARAADEARALREWAQARGLILDPARWLAPARKGGAEHVVWRDDAAGRVIKLTLPGECGWTVDSEEYFDEAWDEMVPRPLTRIATPLEYFDRLMLANELFGDDIALLGVLDAGSGMQVVTSQPTIRGEPPEPDAIAEFFAALGFAMLPPVVVRNSGALSFLRERDGICAFDCHAGNFFLSEGQVLPIDVILVRADERLLNALAATH